MNPQQILQVSKVDNCILVMLDHNAIESGPCQNMFRFIVYQLNRQIYFTEVRLGHSKPIVFIFTKQLVQIQNRISIL